MNALRTHRTAVVAAVSLLPVALGIGAWSRSATRPSHQPPPEVLPVASSAVRHVTVESGGTTLAFTRGAGGAWSGEPGVPPQSTTLISDAEARLFPLRAFRTLEVDTAQPDFGLASPQVTLTVDDQAGTKRTVQIGASTFSTGGVYARRADEPGRVFLVPRRAMDDLRGVLAGQAVVVTNDIPGKIRAINEKQQAEEGNNVSWWLRQVLDASPRPAEGAK
jgi:Domain of unknown function (DUF4340)